MIIYFFLSYRISKDKIKQWLIWFLFKYGNLRVLSLLECIQYLGFKYVTNFGISLGLFDFSVPVSKLDILSTISSFLKFYEECLVRKKRVLFENTTYILNWWNIADCLLKEELISNFRQTNPINPLYVMTVSGARGNLVQIKQIVSMRGIMINSFGEILSFPIKSNFKEGLNIFEYFISCFGARKGVVDTSLKTSTAGYLTRKLVYVTQNIFVKSFTCNSNISFKLEFDVVNVLSYKLIKSKLIGRVVSKDIFNFEKRLLLISKGQDLCYYTLKRIINNKIKVIFFKSPFSCELKLGLCQFCYGWNLVNGQLVEIGESVGILSAQSIGEPGTQLTMRTFHTGGVFSSEFSRMFVSPHKGRIIYTKDFIKPFFFPLLE